MKHIWTALAGLVVLGLFSLTVVACGDDGPGDDASGNDAPDLETVCSDGCEHAIACGHEDDQAECETHCRNDYANVTEEQDEECEVAVLELYECFAGLSCESLGDPEAEEEECADEFTQADSVCELHWN